MTKESLLRWVRRAFEELPGDVQEQVLLRTFNVRVVVWTNLTIPQLYKLYGAVRAAAMLHAGE